MRRSDHLIKKTEVLFSQEKQGNLIVRALCINENADSA